VRPFLVNSRIRSFRQASLFDILHVLRHLDPVLAESLVATHGQLAAATRRYPNGHETMREEARQRWEKRKAEGAKCDGGYILGGGPGEVELQTLVMDGARPGDFAPALADTLPRYRDDSGPASTKRGFKIYWPSTSAYGQIFYAAGKRLGLDAARLPVQVPDDELRLLASIQLVAGLTGVPRGTVVRVG
jgi:hypothetical protein